MTHLMRLELKKVGLKKYVIFSMIGIFISMYFLFVGLNDSSTIKSNYETAFSTVGMIFCVYYITLFSVLVATYIINEYNHKTILVMFSYPIDRRKLMIAVYDLSNCPIPDYPNCLETAQSCVHNSSF